MRNPTQEFLRKLETPGILLDVPALDANIDSMASVCRQNGVALRPHIKTHKSVEIARRQLAAGAVGLTCAKLSEALALLPSGVRSIFLAHSLVSPHKADKLRQLASQLDELIVAVTSLGQAEALEKILISIDLKLPCLIAIDTGLGREGVRNDSDFSRVFQFVEDSDYFTYRGLYTHEGFNYANTRPEIESGIADTAGKLRHYRSLAGKGELWPGSSPTAELMAAQPDITGIRPGAYVFGDLSLTLQTEAMDWNSLATAVITTVVDRPEPSIALIDAGSKVFAMDRRPPRPHAIPLDGRDFGVTKLSEEHGIITGPDVDSLQIGDVLVMVPSHICPVINLSSNLYWWEADDTVTTRPIEGRGCVT